MTRDEVLRRLKDERARFDEALASVPTGRFDDPQATGSHSVKEIVGHVTAYEDLVVQRLRAARRGDTTSFDRDRVGWEEFNDRIWAEVAPLPAEDVLERASETLEALLAELDGVTDAELNDTTGVTRSIDPAWLQGRTLAETLAVDTWDHYPMHLEAIARASQA